MVSGNFQKFGKVATTRKSGLKENDFVMVVYETQNLRRYGVITEILSPHNARVKILHKRTIGKKQTFTPKIETSSTSQIKLVYRKQ